VNGSASAYLSLKRPFLLTKFVTRSSFQEPCRRLPILQSGVHNAVYGSLDGYGLSPLDLFGKLGIGLPPLVEGVEVDTGYGTGGLVRHSTFDGLQERRRPVRGPLGWASTSTFLTDLSFIIHGSFLLLPSNFIN